MLITEFTHPYLTTSHVAHYLRLLGYGKEVDVRQNEGSIGVYSTPAFDALSPEDRHAYGRAIVHSKRYLTELADLREHTPTVGELGYW